MGCEPYIEQRLDSRGVLGRLRVSACAIVPIMERVATMLESQCVGCWAGEGCYLSAEGGRCNEARRLGKRPKLPQSKTSSPQLHSSQHQHSLDSPHIRPYVTRITAHAWRHPAGGNWHRRLCARCATLREGREPPMICPATSPLTTAGHARRRHPRLRVTASEAGATSRLRDAEGT